MPSLLELLLLILATDAAVNAWFYGTLFERIRNWLDKKENLFVELFKCPFCFSYHMTFWLMLLLVIPPLFWSYPWPELCKLPVYSLAVTDIVHLLQQVRPLPELEEDNE